MKRTLILLTFIMLTVPAYSMVEAATAKVKSETKATTTTAREGIAIIVNQDAITTSNIADRMKLIATSTGLPATPEVQSKLRPQIVNILIEEAVKLQEAKRLGVKVTDQEIEKGFATIAGQNNIPPEQFKKILASQGIRLSTLYDQIRAQIAWGKIVQKRIRPRIEVMDSDIDSELLKLKRNIGTTQYHISEIYLPLMDKKKEAAAKDFVARLVEELQKKPEAFPKAAQQFSQTPAAANGGDMGFVTLDQMPKEVASIVPNLKDKQISNGIQTMSGFHIIRREETRTITEKDLPPRDAILQRLGGERLERGARRYMQNLMSSAFIETRL